MKKIININLAGRVIPIEDAAYDSLQRYIESLRRYFAREEGRDEIINDIESRVAELMNDKVRKGAACVTEADMDEIINGMGRVEDFEAAEGEAATASQAAGAGQAYTAAEEQQSRPRFRGRLYRSINDKFLGGVCAGIANYVDLDPVIIRVLFVILGFGGYGILLYILLWIVLPAQFLGTYSGKRFFRNPDDRIIGGVAGGLAAYFNQSTWTIRLIFAAPILLKIFFSILHSIGAPFGSNIGFNIATGSLTGTFILAYIILWIVLPEARTPYEKMEMRGERVDVNRIKQNVQEGMNSFKDRMQAWGEEVKTAGQQMGERAREFSRTQGADFASDFRQAARPAANGVGHAIGVVFKAFFLFIAGSIAFALFVAVLMFTFGGAAQPVNSFLLDGIWQKASLWGILIFFLAVPLVAILTWVIRRAMKVRSQNRYLGWTFGGLWALGWVCIPIFVSSMVKDFRFTERAETTVALRQPRLSKLVVQVPQSPVRYSGNYSWINIDDDAGWDITADSLKLSNVRIAVKQSDDSAYHVTVYRYSAGENRGQALRRAERIEYPVQAMDSVLQLGSGYGVSAGDKFRNQRVLVEIRVPVGRQIRFDRSVGEKLNPFNVRVSENERSWNRRKWNRRDYDIDWDASSYYDWEPDTDYYMTSDGRLNRVGEGAPQLPGQKSDDRIKDSLRREYQRKLDSVETTSLPESLPASARETAMNECKPAKSGVPMPMPFVPALF